MAWEPAGETGTTMDTWYACIGAPALWLCACLLSCYVAWRAVQDYYATSIFGPDCYIGDPPPKEAECQAAGALGTGNYMYEYNVATPRTYIDVTGRLQAGHLRRTACTKLPPTHSHTRARAHAHATGLDCDR